jgi:hypothetical protein
MREIYEDRRAVRMLVQLPREILKRYEKWEDIVRISGPAWLRLIVGFHDEALRGERAEVIARALKCHPAVLVFPGWEVRRESAAQPKRQPDAHGSCKNRSTGRT